MYTDVVPEAGAISTMYTDLVPETDTHIRHHTQDLSSHFSTPTHKYAPHKIPRDISISGVKYLENMQGRLVEHIIVSVVEAVTWFEWRSTITALD